MPGRCEQCVYVYVRIVLMLELDRRFLLLIIILDLQFYSNGLALFDQLFHLSLFQYPSN